MLGCLWLRTEPSQGTVLLQRNPEGHERQYTCPSMGPPLSPAEPRPREGVFLAGGWFADDLTRSAGPMSLLGHEAVATSYH